MKKAILLCGLLMTMAGLAQTFSIDWHKIAGGGGNSSGGQFSLSGTVGQQDASSGAAMAGGGFSLTGGYWSLISVVSTPSAPLLSIVFQGNSVIVSWPSSATNFTLQQNASLATTNWMTSIYPVSTNGSLDSITISPPAGHLFFRLFQ
jgi:hypothetical protein